MYIPTFYVRAETAMTRLRGCAGSSELTRLRACAGSSEPSFITNVINK